MTIFTETIGFGAPYPPKGEGDHGYPAGPPPGYAYPPVPVPFQPDGQGAIMQQPVHGQGTRSINVYMMNWCHNNADRKLIV